MSDELDDTDRAEVALEYASTVLSAANRVLDRFLLFATTVTVLFLLVGVLLGALPTDGVELTRQMADVVNVIAFLVMAWPVVTLLNYAVGKYTERRFA